MADGGVGADAVHDGCEIQMDRMTMRSTDHHHRWQWSSLLQMTDLEARPAKLTVLSQSIRGLLSECACFTIDSILFLPEQAVCSKPRKILFVFFVATNSSGNRLETAPERCGVCKPTTRFMSCHCHPQVSLLCTCDSA